MTNLGVFQCAQFNRLFNIPFNFFTNEPKYLKAFLVYKNVDFPYTHNLSRLLELCLPYGSWVEKLRAAEELTSYAVTARYPEQREKVSKKDALRTIEIASLVRKTLRKILKQEGLNL
jgi:HEPN domain-containing protein